MPIQAIQGHSTFLSRPRPRPILLPKDQDQDQDFIFVLEAPRDQVFGLEDYITGLRIGHQLHNCPVFRDIAGFLFRAATPALFHPKFGVFPLELPMLWVCGS